MLGQTSEEDIFGWIGGILTLIYNIPQIVHVYRTKSVKGVSNVSMSMRFISYFFYIVHVWIKKDWALFYTYCLGVMQILIMLIQIQMYKSNCNKINEKAIVKPRATDASSSDEDV